MPVHIGVFTYMYNVRVFLFFFLSPLYSGKSTLLAAALGQISRLRGKYFSQFQSIPIKYKFFAPRRPPEYKTTPGFIVVEKKLTIYP